MKRVISIVLVFAFVLGLCGCGQKEPVVPVEETQPSPAETVAEMPTEEPAENAEAYIQEEFFDLDSFLTNFGVSNIQYTVEEKPWGSSDGGKTWDYITLYTITGFVNHLELRIESATIGLKRMYPDIFLANWENHEEKNTPTSKIGYDLYGSNEVDLITKATALSTNYEGINIEYNVAMQLNSILTELVASIKK